MSTNGNVLTLEHVLSSFGPRRKNTRGIKKCHSVVLGRKFLQGHVNGMNRRPQRQAISFETFDTFSFSFDWDSTMD